MNSGQGRGGGRVEGSGQGCREEKGVAKESMWHGKGLSREDGPNECSCSGLHKLTHLREGSIGDIQTSVFFQPGNKVRHNGPTDHIPTYIRPSLKGQGTAGQENLPAAQKRGLPFLSDLEA